MLGRDGCPSSDVPLDAPITALAVHAGEQQRVYAVTPAPTCRRTCIAAMTVARPGRRPGTLDRVPVTALVLDPSDPQTLYVSQTIGACSDRRSPYRATAAQSFDTFEQDRDLTLLDVQDNPARLWATTRVVGQGPA